MEVDNGGCSILLPENPDSNNGTAGHSKLGKSLDLLIDGLNADKLKALLDPWLDRYEENIRFIESIQTGTCENAALIASMSGLTGAEIVVRCRSRDQFVGGSIVATFSTIRNYRAICDMYRLDQEQFMKVLGVFAAWEETEFMEFKNIHTLEYIFRHILQRDVNYKSRYTGLLLECQKSTNLSTIIRPVLPMAKPLYLKNADQLYLCTDQVRSKLNRSAYLESSLLSSLDKAVGSFFRQLEKSGLEQARSLGARPRQSETSSFKGLKRNLGSDGPSAASHSRQPLIGGMSKRPREENIQDVRPQQNLENVTTVGTSNRDSTSVSGNCPIIVTISDDTGDSVAPKSGLTNRPGGLKAEQGPIHTPSQTPKIVSVRSLASVDSCNRSAASTQFSGGADAWETISLADVKPEEDLRSLSVMSSCVGSLPVSSGPSLEMGMNEEGAGTGLRSILDSLAGMHAVVPCGDLGRIIEHGSVDLPEYGEILVRRGRVVLLGDFERGFRAPNPQLEFHFPMERLDDFFPAANIRFEGKRSMYLNEVITEFYFL